MGTRGEDGISEFLFALLYPPGAGTPCVSCVGWPVRRAPSAFLRGIPNLSVTFCVRRKGNKSQGRKLPLVALAT